MAIKNTGFGGTDWIETVGLEEVFEAVDINDTFNITVNYYSTIIDYATPPVGSIVAWQYDWSADVVFYDGTVYGYPVHRVDVIGLYVTGAQLIAGGMTSGQAFTIHVYSRFVKIDGSDSDSAPFRIWTNTSASVTGATMLYEILYSGMSGTTAWALTTLGILASSWNSSTYFLYTFRGDIEGYQRGYSQFYGVSMESPSRILPSGWVECNGQVLSDAGSPINGQTIPALNGTTDATKKFLRGNTTSGGTGGSNTHTHGYDNSDNMDPGTNSYRAVMYFQDASSLPPYYELRWIMRVK